MAAITKEVLKSESSKSIFPRDVEDASGGHQGEPAPRWYLLQFSFSSTLLFASYLTMQNLLTAVIGDNGFIALAIVYAGMALSSNLGEYLLFALPDSEAISRLNLLGPQFSIQFLEPHPRIRRVDN